MKKVFNAKKVMGLTILSCFALCATGCMRVYDTLTVNGDGTITDTQKQAISKQYIDDMGGTTEEGYTLETLEDGNQYYVTTATQTVTASELSEGSNVTLNSDIFYYGIAGDSDETVNSGYTIADAIEQSIYVKMTVNLGSDIVETNANVTAETSGKTATFDTGLSGSSWYAYTAHGKELIDADTTAPVIQNAKDGKSYQSITDISFTDDTGIASATINGKSYSPLNAVNGKNIITVTDIKGNSTSVTIYLDTKAPTIKGIQNNSSYQGKAVFYVKDSVALSKVTVDGKKQKISNKSLVKKGKYKKYYKFTIKKKGSHTIVAADSAGNKKKIKITVK